MCIMQLYKETKNNMPHHFLAVALAKTTTKMLVRKKQKNATKFKKKEKKIE